VDVDPVEEGPGDARPVALHGWRGTGALVPGVAQVPAGAGIHGGDEHEAGRIGQADGGPGDGDAVVLERLAQGLDDVVAELGKFVEEEDAVVGQGDFAGPGVRAAADQPGVRDGVLMGGKYLTFLFRIIITTDFYTLQTLTYDSEFVFRTHSGEV